MEEELKLPAGRIPELPPKALPPEAIEAWREEAPRDLLRRGLLEALRSDPTRTPRPPRFRLVDEPGSPLGPVRGSTPAGPPSGS